MSPNSPSSRAAKARPRNVKPSAQQPNGSSSAPRRRASVFDRLDIAVVLRPIGELKPYARNARSHPRTQLDKLAASIREFGFLILILVDGEHRIIAGHARVEAARLLGLAQVPTMAIHHLSDAQIRAFRIADNRLAELATWDQRALALELRGSWSRAMAQSSPRSMRVTSVWWSRPTGTSNSSPACASIPSSIARPRP